jgi:anti-sigma factor RsiW
MSCQLVRESISSYLDNLVTEPERKSIGRHLAVCGECAALHLQTAQLRQNLRSLRPARAPKRLTLDLRILASREAMRQRGTLLGFWMERARLFVDNLMRPLALPFAGGLASAVFMFGMMISNLGSLRDVASVDRPTALSTEASVDNVADFGARSKSNDDTLIEVEVDGQGTMVDYYIPDGHMTSEIGNLLLFSKFTPATKFLRPASGKVIIRLSRIVVKG